MNELRIMLQREARRLLDAGEVDVVIGYQRTDIPWKMAPVFVFSKDECDKLDISSFCVQNLAVYLPRIVGRVGIIAKPCDVRTILQMIQENQVDRERVRILSFRCPGMLDPRKLEAKGVSPDRLLEIGSNEHPDALHDWCKICFHREPPEADFVGEPRFLFQKDEYPRPEDLTTQADRIQEKPPEERLQFWLDEFSRCIRCKACMRSCPIYYGGGEALDDRPFTAQANRAAENFQIHLYFALDLAGRCTICGACESACPVDIPLMGLHIPLYKKTRDAFGFEPGLQRDTYTPYEAAEPLSGGGDG